MSRSALFGWLRISLLVLLLVVLVAHLLLSSPERVDWQTPVRVSIYPVDADHRPATRAYIGALTTQSFHDIETFFSRQARRYRLKLAQPIQVRLAHPIEALPPAVPAQASILESIWWSVKMRVWVWRHDRWSAQPDAIRIFMSFYAPDNPQGWQHSLGLQKGRIGLVNGFASADRQGFNNYVAAHELLHTLGASDKYDTKTGRPLWPDGFADPVKQPLFPQLRAEIMAGRVQVTPGWALLPPNLQHAVIGSATAIEIGWMGPDVQAFDADGAAPAGH